jgi:hypothetical protein
LPEEASVRGRANAEQGVGRGQARSPIGRPGDSSTLIAKRVQQLACTADVVVWHSDDRIFAALASAAAKVPPGALIGIYGVGVLLAEIERDLGQALRRG